MKTTFILGNNDIQTLIDLTLFSRILECGGPSLGVPSAPQDCAFNRARAFQARNMVCTKSAWACLHETYCNQWKIESLNKPKLRTYVKFKTCFKIEDYVMTLMRSQQRSYLAQLNCGILPLHIEMGRWYGVQEEYRL